MRTLKLYKKMRAYGRAVIKERWIKLPMVIMQTSFEQICQLMDRVQPGQKNQQKWLSTISQEFYISSHKVFVNRKFRENFFDTILINAIEF